MPSRLLGVLTGALIMLCCAASVASAAGPAPVSIRVEGDTQTLVPLTSLTTTNTPVVKDGNPQDSCTGTSAAGALEQGTHGDWTGSFSKSFGYSVDTIKGETHLYPDPSYFTLWVNNKFSQTGVCDTELQAGDDVLFFVDSCTFDPNINACSNPPVLPLGVNAPRQAERGKPFTVTVVHYEQNGTAVKEPGATVASGSEKKLTGADGTVTFSAPPAGNAVTVQAEKTLRARSAPATVCLSDGDDGTCGTADKTPPLPRIGGIKQGQTFAAGHGPRKLRGSVGIDSSGLRDVSLRISRRVGSRCYAYGSRKERFVRRSCRAPRASFFSIGDRQDWSYLLPGRLPAGRYVLDVVATDKNGNRSHLKLGVSRVVFRVKGS